MCSPCPCSLVNTEKTGFILFFFFSRCLYHCVFRTWVHRAWGTRLPQDNPGNCNQAKKQLIIFISKPQCALALSSAQHCNGRGLGRSPRLPPQARVYGNRSWSHEGLWSGVARSHLPCPCGQRPPWTCCQTPHPQHATNLHCGAFVIVLVISELFTTISDKERIKYGCIGLWSLPVT